MAQDVTDNEFGDVRFREDEEMDFFTELALHEAERWIQAVTRKKFQYPDDFRKSLGNGILLCELLNNIKPGAVKRINKLPGPIAGLDNINVFLRSCAQNFGLNEAYLFDPADLEDLSHRAISDEDENLLKQEVDRRARNVAVTIYWLGKKVSGDNKVPPLDPSAFAALVHSHGNKNLISNESFKNDSWQQLESPDKDHLHKHIRDSSYDSLGSYEPESESSFDDLDGSMPVRSDMKENMKRYGSQGSLSRDLRLSAASDTQYSDKYDSMYQSSPDLSQGSHAHTRSSSTDSAEGGYYGNHSRQSSGSTENYPTRPTRLSSSSARKTSTSTPDPLQFVKIKGAQELAKTAEKQIEIAKEVNKMRGVVDSGGGSLTGEPDWQSNFKNWKNKRRKSTPAFASVGEDEDEEREKEEKVQTRGVKTFSQMMADRNKRRSLGPMNFYPLDDDDSGLSGSIGQVSEPAMTQSNSNRTESKPQGRKSKKADVAPWAQGSSGEADSQSDSETNNSQQSGDTDSVFSDKSTPSRILSDEDSWVKSSRDNNLHSANKISPVSRPQARPSDNLKRWETSGFKKDEKKKVELPKGTANIRNITKAYEQKDKEASTEPVVMRRKDFAKRSSFDWAGDKVDGSQIRKSVDLSHRSPSWQDRSPMRKSLDLSHKSPSWQVEAPLSPTANKALLPRDQRYSWTTPPKDSPPNNNLQDKHSSSTSQRSRYLETSSPPRNSKLLTFGIQGDKIAERSPTSAAVIPTSNKIRQAKAMFEKPLDAELQKPPTGRRRLSENAGQESAVNKSVIDGKTDDVQEMPNGSHSDISTDTGYDDNSDVKDIKSETETTGENKENNDDRSENVEEDSFSAKTAEINTEIDTHKDDKVSTSNQPSENGIASEESIGPSDQPEQSCKRKDIKNGVYSCDSLADDAMSKQDHENGKSENVETYNEKETVDETVVGNDNGGLLELKNDQTNEILEPEVQGRTDISKTALIVSPEYSHVSEDKRETLDQLNPVEYENEAFRANDIDDAALAIEAQQQEGNSSNRPKEKDYTERSIKISQKPNNQRGFGFTLSGGMDKHTPLTVARVSLAGSVTDDDDDDVFISERSGADINELERDDEIILLNGHDTAQLTHAQAQAIVDHAVKRGMIELLVKRFAQDEGEFDSGQEDDFSPPPASVNNSNNNNSRDGYYSYPTTDTSVTNSRPSPARDLEHTYSRPSPAKEPVPDYSKPVLEVSVRTDNNRPSLMDQLVKEKQQQEQQDKQQQLDKQRQLEKQQQQQLEKQRQLENQQQLDKQRQLEKQQQLDRQQQEQQDKQQKIKQQQLDKQHETNNNESKTADDKDEEGSDSEVIERMVENFSFSSHTMPKIRGLPEAGESDSNPPEARESDTNLVEMRKRESDMNRPPSEFMVEERPTLQVKSVKGSVPGAETITEERSVISMTVKTSETPESSPVAPMRRHRTPDRTDALKVEASPPPPTPPKAEPPALMKPNDSEDNSGFGPPAALMRWQRPRVKTEYQTPFPSTSLDEQLKASKRLSSTLPYGTKSPFSLDTDYSKDDSSLGRGKGDTDLSKSNVSLGETYHFDDSARLQAWQQKQETERKPDPQPTYAPIEVPLQEERTLTAQYAEPGRRAGQVSPPDLSNIIVPSSQPAPLSPQEKFEQDQARIRRQYEEERRKAQEVEKKKKEEEQKVLNSDKFLQSMEAQVIQTKQLAQELNSMEPVRPAPTQPKFNTEPMTTIRIPASSQGRQLVIDPRNRDDSKPEAARQEYSFHVDIQGSSKPPLRTLNTEPEISQAELLERERQKIREEENRKFEEQKQRWQQEQERNLQQQQESLRQERERLQKEEERIAREKAALEQREKAALDHRRPQEEHFSPQYQPSSFSGPSVAISHPPRSTPHALDPKYREAKKAPPPTAPKPKARLTREDLLMMNRKATPMTKRPEGMEENGPKGDHSSSVREAPTKAELHSLNAVPKPRYHNSGAWIKDEEPDTEKPFVIGKRSDIIHNTDNANPQEHWVVREAERRRKSEQNNRSRDYDHVTARAGPTKPSQSSLISHFRGDVEPPPRTNKYSFASVPSSDSRLSSTSARPLSSSMYDNGPEKNVMQFSAKTSPNSYSNPSLTQTLPSNFSFNANLPVSRDAPAVSSRPPRSPSGGSEAVMAVSGKQKCSHCGEELAGLKFSKV